MKKIWHHWEKWECAKAGFYSEFKDIVVTKSEAKQQYKEFLSDLTRFEKALIAVTTAWKYSCEHFLTGSGINKIAWLGQASCAYALGLPAEARGGFKLLSEDEQKAANALALKYLKRWERAQKNSAVSLEVETERLPRRHPRRSPRPNC